MKKSAKTPNESTNSSSNDTVESSPWDEIKRYDKLHSDRAIAPREAWEMGYQLVTSFLLVSLIQTKPRSTIVKKAYFVAWSLPMRLLDDAAELAESLWGLYRQGGFAIVQPGNQMVVTRSKSEAKSLLDSVKTARHATEEEIQTFLFEKAQSATAPE